jgi:hypothetical protein
MFAYEGIRRFYTNATAFLVSSGTNLSRDLPFIVVNFPLRSYHSSP